MTDFCNTMDAVVLENDIDLILQQIEILLDSSPGDVIGDSNFGCRFEDYLYQTSLGNKTVATRIATNILSNVELFDWHLDVKVEFLAGTENDILMFRIEVYKETESYSKIYKVTQGDVSKYAILTPVA